MFNKKFTFTYSNGLTLPDREETNRFIYEKAEHFKYYSNYSNKEELLKFFQEILDMICHDDATAEFDFSDISGSVGFPYKKKDMIRWYDIAHIMGSVFFLAFDAEENKLKNILDGVHGAISTSGMMAHAYNELVAHKIIKTNSEKMIPAYGATLIFATLFECELKTHTRIYYTKKYLSQLKAKIDSSEITLTENEFDLFKFLSFRFAMVDSESDKKHDAITALDSQYKLLVKYNIINKKDEELKDILLENATLNKLLNNKYFKNITDERFWKIISILFNVKKLNLRNNLTHCNFGRTNYYALSVTALLYTLVCMVSNEHFLKN